MPSGSVIDNVPWIACWLWQVFKTLITVQQHKTSHCKGSRMYELKEWEGLGRPNDGKMSTWGCSTAVRITEECKQAGILIWLEEICRDLSRKTKCPKLKLTFLQVKWHDIREFSHQNVDGDVHCYYDIKVVENNWRKFDFEVSGTFRIVRG